MGGGNGRAERNHHVNLYRVFASSLCFYGMKTVFCWSEEETEIFLNLLRHKNISEEKQQRMTQGLGKFNAAKLPTAPSDDHTVFVQDPGQQMEKLQMRILKVC